MLKQIGKIILLFTALFALTACGTKEETNDEKTKGDKIIHVGTMGTYEPFTYQDENGKLTGFDIEVLRALEPHMDGYTFEFTASPWDTLFVGLEADRFQLLANQIASTPERQEKYNLTAESYFKSVTQPIVREDETAIQSLADLSGKKVGVTVGDNHTRSLEDYNEANNAGIQIEYYESDINSVLQDLINGRIDATVNDPIMARRKADVLNLAIKSVNDNLHEDEIFFIMKKDAAGDALKAAVDGALEIIKEDGTLDKLVEEWFGTSF